MGRLERLQERRIDQSVLVKASMVNEVYEDINEAESVKYAIGAMQPIDTAYTRNTFLQGERVREQLNSRLKQDCDYEFQGSVATDTHIRAHSDIDLLMILQGWWWLEEPQKSENPYRGSPEEDMRALRRDATSAMRSAFPSASVDDTRSRAIKVVGGSLTRDVDVVPGTWFHTNMYTQTKEPWYRGVKVFDSGTGLFIANQPFFHRRQLHGRDTVTTGGLRKAIRLMKTLRYDSDGRSDISSYNICGLAFNIPQQFLAVGRPRELAILEACHTYCRRLLGDMNERSTIKVPDGHRSVFGGSDGATVGQLQALYNELDGLRTEVLRDIRLSLKDLAEARVDYRVRIGA